MAGLPASALTLKIPVPDLLALPAGASYHGKNGQAGVDVTSRGDTLVVTSTCDSLQRLVLWYEEELTRIRGDTVSVSEVSETEFKQRFNPVKIALIAFIAGMASGIVSTFLIKRRNGKNKNFIYGIARVKFDDQPIGWIEKGSWDWGGTKSEIIDVDAEQVPDAPVLTLIQKNGQVSPTFNLIQMDYKNIKAVLGGTLVGTEGAPTGWKAPTELVRLAGKWTIDFMSGQTMTIPNGTILANLGGKLTLTEVSKIECQLKVNKPEDGSSPYEINDTAAVEG